MHRQPLRGIQPSAAQDFGVLVGHSGPAEASCSQQPLTTSWQGPWLILKTSWSPDKENDLQDPFITNSQVSGRGAQRNPFCPSFDSGCCVAVESRSRPPSYKHATSRDLLFVVDVPDMLRAASCSGHSHPGRPKAARAGYNSTRVATFAIRWSQGQ